MLDIPAPLIRQLQDQVFAHYPGECCGLLVGPPGGGLVSRALPLENIADRLHALDPAAYPRTSRDAFMVNEAKLARLVREAEAAGERWLAFYHSHIDCGAYFSAEDKKYAAPEGAAVFPEVVQLVIACSGAAITAAKAFRWDGRDFALLQDLPAFVRTRP
jgi:proteasome lid subunit RPN8/RPN11